MRAEPGHARAPLPEEYLRRLGDLEICAMLRSVSFAGDGVEVELTAMEFDVFCRRLRRRTNAVLSREKIR